MKLPKFITNNKVLKITSVNAVVIGIRLVVSFFVQQILARALGNTGYALVGDIRNLIPMLTSTSSLGVFSGVVKYVSELKNNKPELVKVFSTSSVFLLLGSLLTSSVLFFLADTLSRLVFGDVSFSSIIKLLAFIVPFISLNRLLSSVVNALSDYKNYAKIELIGYMLGVIALLVGLYYYGIKGVLIAIAITPVFQFIVGLSVYWKTLLNYVQPKKLRFNLSYKQQLLAFTLMSFISTFLINFIELGIRSHIENEISASEAGNWTAIVFISKNYMVFASGLFTLYVIPKFAQINSELAFKKEVIYIYKTILPIFGLGMLLVYILRFLIIDYVFTGFDGMAPLFKWQLLGDFVKLASMVLAHHFLAKKMVKSFIITELISLILFYVLSTLLIKFYVTEGVVIAHFIRCIIYFIFVILLVKRYYMLRK